MQSSSSIFWRARHTRVVTLACGLAAAACNPCLGSGANAVAEPQLDQYQLIFNNIVSRDTDLYVDGALAGTLCEETEQITVGNFRAHTQSTIVIRSPLGGLDCSISPCCDGNCNNQVCNGPGVIDTTPFAGRVYVTGLIWDMR